MDWIDWIFLIVTVGAVSFLAYMRIKGYINTDSATIGITAIVELVRRAEELWKDYQGAGADKKAWVLAQLEKLGEKYDDTTAAGAMIDAIVSWLNATGWE